jgi:hypothetical protein
MKTKRVYIYVNGILTVPGESENWTGKAVTWTHLHTNDVAEKVEYWVGPISRAFGRGQRKRAEKLAKTVHFYAISGYEIILAGHSNGGSVIGDAIRLMPPGSWKAIKHVHLISPASKEDFEVNGLNLLGAPVTVYIAGQDTPLALASGPGRLLGYGGLGKVGPVNAKVPTKVVTREEFGHGTWFESEYFDSTMWSIINLA